MRHHKHKTLRSIKDLCPTWKIPVATGGQQVIIQQVYPRDPNTLQWNFSSSVSSAPANVPQLLASGDGSTFHAPTGVTAADGGIAATYSSPVLSAGCVYSVTAPPAGVTFASGTLSVPQTGTVISSEEALEIAGAQGQVEEAEAPATLRLPKAKTRGTKAKRSARPSSRRAA